MASVGEHLRRLRHERDEWLRLLSPLFLLIAIVLIGTLGYRLIEGWKPLDALYMAAIGITSVGFGEVEPLSPAGKVFTIMLVFAAFASAGYTVSTLTSFIVNGEITRMFQARKMDTRIQRLADHIILCGAGRVGWHIAEELHKTQTPFVVIERNLDSVSDLERIGDVLYIKDDATSDETLRQAGIDRASGLVVALGDDKDNVYLVLTARTLNPHLRIIARVNADENADKLRRAGADELVSPDAIGGLRMASVILRPAVVHFLDEMLRVPDAALRIDEIPVDDFPALIGKTLDEVDLAEKTGLLVVALLSAGGYQFNPDGATRLVAGDVVIVMGTSQQRDRLRRAVRS